MKGKSKILPRKSIAKGQTFIQEGDEGVHAFFIQDGLVEVYNVGPGGQETTVGQLHKGQIVGEMALIADVPRTACARALEVTTVVVIQPEILNKKMRDVDPLLVGLMETFIGMIRRMNQHYKPPAENLKDLRKALGADARSIVKYVPGMDHEDFLEETERLLEDLDDLIMDYVGDDELESYL